MNLHPAIVQFLGSLFFVDNSFRDFVLLDIVA